MEREYEDVVAELQSREYQKQGYSQETARYLADKDVVNRSLEPFEED